MEVAPVDHGKASVEPIPAPAKPAAVPVEPEAPPAELRAAPMMSGAAPVEKGFSAAKANRALSGSKHASQACLQLPLPTVGNGNGQTDRQCKI